MESSKKISRLVAVLILTAAGRPASGAEVPPEILQQPPEARAFQEMEFPRLIAIVEERGLVPDGHSRLFWWQVDGEVGPLVVQAVAPGSAAAAAGFLPGDIVEEIRGIPHYLIPGALQRLEIKGGAANLGHQLERARDFGFTEVTLGVRRGGSHFEVVLAL
jgi:hypothetical protein